VGDVGDRHDQMPAARIGRVGVGLGPYRVVEIARVAAVDRDQRQVAQAGAAGGVDRLCRGSLFQRRGRKFGRNAKRGDRQEADRAGCLGRSEPLDDAQPRRAVAARGQGLGDDKLPIGGSAGVGGIDKILGAIAAVGRCYPAAIAKAAQDADDAV
jgi:hypothetical protein